MSQQRAPLLQRVFAHIMTLGLCVAMPAVVMLIMPVASTTFTRAGGNVSATSVRKVFFVIPFQTETVADVVGVDDQYVHGTLTQTTRSGPVNDPKRPVTRTEDMSWLVIQGRGASLEVPVSPVNLDDTRRKVRDFLEDGSQPELRLFTVANWKISVITGGVLTLLTLIYVGSVVLGIVSLFLPKRAET
jgi:hypothetical protein